MSVQALMASKRQVRLTMAFGGGSEQKCSTNAEGRASLISSALVPCRLASMDSGMLSAGVHFVAMILYPVAIPFYNRLSDSASRGDHYRPYSDHSS